MAHEAFTIFSLNICPIHQRSAEKRKWNTETKNVSFLAKTKYQNQRKQDKNHNIFWFIDDFLFVFGLIFVIKGVPGIHPVKCCSGGPEGVPGVFQMCSGVLWGVPGLFQILQTPSTFWVQSYYILPYHYIL